MAAKKLEVFGIPAEHWVLIVGGAVVVNQLYRAVQRVREAAADEAEAAAAAAATVTVNGGGSNVGEQDAAAEESTILSLPSVRMSILVTMFVSAIAAVVLWRILKPRWRQKAQEDDASTEVISQSLFPKQAAAEVRRRRLGAIAPAAPKATAAAIVGDNGGGGGGGGASKNDPPTTPTTARQSGHRRGPVRNISERPPPGRNRAPVVGRAKKSPHHTRSKDKIAVAMQGMFSVPDGKEAMLQEWEDSVAAKAGASGGGAAAAVTEVDEEDKAAALAKRMNAITARKQVRNFLLNHDLGEYADRVLAFGADSLQRLRSLTAEDLTSIGVKELHKRELLQLLQAQAQAQVVEGGGGGGATNQGR